jgi:hypothetical protein
MSFKGIPHDEWGISSSKWPSDVWLIILELQITTTDSLNASCVFNV